MRERGYRLSVQCDLEEDTILRDLRSKIKMHVWSSNACRDFLISGCLAYLMGMGLRVKRWAIIASMRSWSVSRRNQSEHSNQEEIDLARAFQVLLIRLERRRFLRTAKTSSIRYRIRWRTRSLRWLSDQQTWIFETRSLTHVSQEQQLAP